MVDARFDERTRLIRERTRHADAARRTWSFALQNVLALILYALAPLVPRARHLFGALSVPQGLAIILPGCLAVVASVVVYKRFGSGSTAYRIAEVTESLLLYGSNVAMVFRTEMSWPVVWILCPFTTLFWAITKPSDGRLPASIVTTAHAALALAYVVRGDAHRAWISMAVGVASYLTFVAIARQGRRNLTLEAERNVARAKLNEAVLDQERRRVANALGDGIGHEITELAGELDSEDPGQGRPEIALAEGASAVASELDGIVDVTKRRDAACSLVELLPRVDAKCRPLCADLAYDSALVLDAGVDGRELPLDGERAHAIVRIARELVRNAVVHGGARAVRVELALRGATVTMSVVDDGVGLARERFERATGGLDNAMQSLREHGGTLELIERPEPAGPTGDVDEARGPRWNTALRATIPMGMRSETDGTAVAYDR